MKWTKKLPQQDGYYFFSFTSLEDFVQLIYVKGSDYTFDKVCLEDPTCRKPLAKLGRHSIFAGPIKMPKHPFTLEKEMTA